MASQQVSTLLLLLSILRGVRGDYSTHLAPLVVAGASALVLLIVIIAVLAMALSWKHWFPAIQRSKGKVKMPRSYWKKKEEAKLRLLNTSRASRVTTTTVLPAEEKRTLNGSASAISRVQDTASWVQGWNNANPPDDKGYEELALAMDLGEEKEEPEFRIETSVVDNETLDLGPFGPTDLPQAHSQTAAPQGGTSEQAVTMDLGAEPPEEHHVSPLMDRPRQISSSQTPPPPPSPPSSLSGGEQEVPSPRPEQATAYSQFLDSSMVAF